METRRIGLYVTIPSVKRQLLVLAASLVAFAALFPVPAFAATVRSDGQLVVSGDEALTGNNYLAGASVEVYATTTSDLAAVGYRTKVLAPVGGDLTLVSGSSQVLSPVGGDLRIVGGRATVDAVVGGDLVIVGANVYIAPNTIIAGDLVLVAGVVDLEGEVLGTTKVASGQATINGMLGRGGDITAARSINFGPRAEAGSVVSYFSPAVATITNENSTLSKLLRHNKIPPIAETGVAKRAILQFLAFWHLLSFISNLLIGLVIAYGSRSFASDFSREFRKKPGRSFLAGFGFFVLAPIAAALAMVSLFAMPVGLLILLAILAVGIIAAPLASVALGRAVLSIKGEPERKVNFREVALGAVLLALLGLLPQVGFWIKLILGIVAVGAATRVSLNRMSGPSPLFQALSAIRGETKDSEIKN